MRMDFGAVERLKKIAMHVLHHYGFGIRFFPITY